MILAGLDEAGYGPLLGPLVVGCSAFELTDVEPSDDLPCLWLRLSKLVSKKRLASGRKVHINDSKQVYAPQDGLKELERGVLTILAAAGNAAVDLASLLALTAAHVVPELAGYPWYKPIAGGKFPLEQEAISIQLFANGLRAEMQRQQITCVYFAARVVLEGQLNRMMAATRNKASTLFSTGAIHLDHLIRMFGDRGLVIFCDRQGGREHYGALLRLMFDEWSLEVIEELEGRCDYRLHRKGHVVRIIYREKAEGQCLPVALASMLSKYLREALMQRFNYFWAQHIPGVAPTAGYYGDGTRFLRDIESKRREMGIEDGLLIRSR